MMMHRYIILNVVVLSIVLVPVVIQSQNITDGKGCYYKGSFHYSNWTDGCDFTCTCLDVNTGHYKCKTRCPVYHQLPHGCELKLPYGEDCCRQPDCSAVTVPRTIITNNHSANNGNNSDNVISNNKNIDTYINSGFIENNVNNNSNDDNGINSNKNGRNKSNVNDNNKNDNNSDKNNNTLENGDINNSSISRNAYLDTISNSRDLFNINNTRVNSSVNDDYQFYKTFNTTRSPNVTMNITAEGEKGCLYKGMYYNGSWTEGCEKTCTCDDPLLGTYSCRKRCREYTDLEPGCILKVSAGDNCCWVPECNITEQTIYDNQNNTEAINNTENYTNFINTKHIDYIPQSEHLYNANYIDNIENNVNNNNDVMSITTDNLKTSTPTTLPPIHVVATKSTSDVLRQTYTQPKENNGYKVIKENNKTHLGNSEILNAAETEKLAIIFSRFGPIRLFTVKKEINTEEAQDKEIHLRREDFLKDRHSQRQNIINARGFASDNNYAVTAGVCKYKGRTFTQDERWNDGCNATCVCENAENGIYKCRSRCKEYKALPIGCIMRQSHVDDCCLIPDCRHATVADGNHVLTSSSRLVSKIQQIGNTEKSLLKRLFNQRNKMRNKHAFSVKEKIIGVEITKKMHNAPIVIKTNDLLRRGNVHQIEHAVDRTNDISTNLQNYYKLPTYPRQNERTRFHILHSNKLNPKQEIVTPYNLINSNQEFKRGLNTNRRNNDVNGQKFRSIATQTGLYKVRKKDGVITSESPNLSNDVIGKPYEVTSSRNGHNINSTSNFCQHRERRYSEGDILFDGCERKCICKSNGKFICKQRCPVHRRVPSGCALLPPRTGQCCSTIVCRRIPTRNNPPASYFNI